MIELKGWPYEGHLPPMVDEDYPQGCRGNCDGTCEGKARKILVAYMKQTNDGPRILAAKMAYNDGWYTCNDVPEFQARDPHDPKAPTICEKCLECVLWLQ